MSDEEGFFALLADLPRDIIPNILVRLPFKSLARFKSVSKSWLKLITSLLFRNRSLDDKCSYKLTGGISSPIETSGITDPPLDIPVCDIGLGEREIVGSCNGMLCLLHDFCAFGLLNPTTGEYKRLPKVVGKVRRDSDSYINYGFGYDPISKEYLVLVIRGYWDSYFTYPCEPEIYTSGTNSWKKLGMVPGLTVDVRYTSPGKFVHGAIHWLARFIVVSEHRRQAVLAFNVTRRSFQEISLPDCDKTGRPPVAYITDLNGYLCFICYFENYIKVWAMRNYPVKDSWVVMFGIENLSAVPKSMKVCTPVWITMEGDVALLDDESELLYLYDVINKSYKGVRIGNRLLNIRNPVIFTVNVAALNDECMEKDEVREYGGENNNDADEDEEDEDEDDEEDADEKIGGFEDRDLEEMAKYIGQAIYLTLFKGKKKKPSKKELKPRYDLEDEEHEDDDEEENDNEQENDGQEDDEGLHNQEHFDDVQKAPNLSTKAPKEIKELDENKSKKGLGEIYEAAPVVVSDAAMLAPKEVFAGKGDIKEEAELIQAERKANKKTEESKEGGKESTGRLL